jgi:hypothetical protein
MMMLKRTIAGALAAGALVVFVAVPGTAVARSIPGQSTLHVASCTDAYGGPGGGCPTAVNGK